MILHDFSCIIEFIKWAVDIKCKAVQSILSFFTTSNINSISLDSIYHHTKLLWNHFFALKHKNFTFIINFETGFISYVDNITKYEIRY